MPLSYLNKNFVYNDSEQGFGTFENLSNIVDQTNNGLNTVTNDVSALLAIDTSALLNTINTIESDVSSLQQDIENLDASVVAIINTLSYGYTIFVQADADDAGDNDLVYFCSTPHTPSPNELQRAVFVPKDGKIISASIIMNVYSGNVGSAQDVSVWIRKNRTTDYHIATVADSSTLRIFQNNSLNVDVSRGDIIVIKVQHPSYSTNPGMAGWSGNLFLTAPIS